MDALEFIVARYNYWIVIILMMTGLYTVIARGNLVKKIIGLNLFQTSVFIFYITIGKISGGTAPIYLPGDMEARANHGADRGEGAPAYDDAIHAENGALGEGPADESLHGDMPANDLGAAIESTEPIGEVSDGAVHAVPGDAANELLRTEGAPDPSFNIETPDAIEAGGVATGSEHAAQTSDAAQAVIDVVYSNPLPHVLILTAIVVGVATTAVGLALAVRIREAYGTIEEDELEAADNIAEFGGESAAGGASA